MLFHYNNYKSKTCLKYLLKNQNLGKTLGFNFYVLPLKINRFPKLI